MKEKCALVYRDSWENGKPEIVRVHVNRECLGKVNSSRLGVMPNDKGERFEGEGSFLVCGEADFVSSVYDLLLNDGIVVIIGDSSLVSYESKLKLVQRGFLKVLASEIELEGEELEVVI